MRVPKRVFNYIKAIIRQFSTDKKCKVLCESSTKWGTMLYMGKFIGHTVYGISMHSSVIKPVELTHNGQCSCFGHRNSEHISHILFELAVWPRYLLPFLKSVSMWAIALSGTHLLEKPKIRHFGISVYSRRICWCGFVCQRSY